jgi:hypothetical protein
MDSNNSFPDFVTVIGACDNHKYHEEGEYSIYVTIPVADLNDPHKMLFLVGDVLQHVDPVDENEDVTEPQLIIRHDNDGYVLYIEVYRTDSDMDVVFEKILEPSDFLLFVEKIGVHYTWYDDFGNHWIV